MNWQGSGARTGFLTTYLSAREGARRSGVCARLVSRDDPGGHEHETLTAGLQRLSGYRLDQVPALRRAWSRAGARAAAWGLPRASLSSVSRRRSRAVPRLSRCAPCGAATSPPGLYGVCVGSVNRCGGSVLGRVPGREADMGIPDSGEVEVDMTLTSLGCLEAPRIIREVRERLRALPRAVACSPSLAQPPPRGWGRNRTHGARE